METLEESVAIAEHQQRLDTANDEFLATKQRVGELSGLRRKTIGGFMLRKAINTAESQGLIVINGSTIVPRAVSLEYFNSVDDY